MFREADIWSLGCTVYEMATGHPPWSEFPDQVSALFHIASVRSPPPLKNLNLSGIALDFIRTCLKV
jgi:serine/threonine protein kinase